MFNKKADSEMSLVVLSRFFVIAVIVGALFYVVYTFSSSDQFTLKSSAVDFSLEVDALLSLPADTSSFIAYNFQYPVDLEIRNNKIILAKDDLTSEFSFTGDPSVDVQNLKLNNIQKVFLLKDGNSLSFSKEEPIIKNFYSCPKNTLDLFDITFDPGKGFDESRNLGSKGVMVDSRSESLHTLEVASFLSYISSLRFSSTRPVSSRLTDSFISINDIKKDVNDALISLHVGFVDNSMKIYINNKKESAILACNILNNFKKNFNIQKSAIIPVNFNLINDDDYRNVLNIDKPSIFIEIGSEKDKLILEKQKIVSSIVGGVLDA